MGGVHNLGVVSPYHQITYSFLGVVGGLYIRTYIDHSSYYIINTLILHKIIFRLGLETIIDNQLKL